MSQRRAACLVWSLILALALAPQIAEADDAAQARFHFERAVRLTQQKRWEDALREFFIARRLANNPYSLFNIAACFDRLAQHDKAFYFYGEYLRETDVADERSRAARRALKRLRQKVGVIEVRTDPPGASVKIDRPELGSYGTTPALVPVSSGRHTVWLEKAGFRTSKHEVTIKVGEQVKKSVVLTRIVGRLYVHSEPIGSVLVLEPSGATVARGRSPYRVELPPGPYEVEVFSPGYRRSRTFVVVKPDAEVTKRAVLEMLPPATGELIVASNRPRALVEVDGQMMSFAPAVLTGLSTGSRSVRVSSEGTVPWVGQIEVREEQRGFLTVNLEEPPALRRSVATWIVGGAGAAALLAGGVTGALTLDVRGEYEDRRNSPDGTDSRGLYEQSLTLQTTTDVLLISGVVLLGVSTLLYFVTEEEDTRRTRHDFQ